MRISSATPHLLSTAAAFISLTWVAGAAPGSVQARPVVRVPAPAGLVPAARWSREAKGPLIYVGEYDNGKGIAVVQAISVATHKVVGQITGLGYPTGLTVDGAGNLFVVEAGLQNPEILEFPPGATSPSRTISEAGYEPSAVAVAADGTVYVANFCQGDGISCFGNGYTVIYPPAGGPQYLDVVGAPAFLALRSTGQLVISGDQNAPTGDFPKIVPVAVTTNSKGGFTILRLPGFKKALLPHIAFDAQGRLALMAGGNRSNSFLELFRLPSPRIIATVPFQGVVRDFAFPAGGRSVWTLQYVSGAGDVAQEVTYPVGNPIVSIPVDIAYGSNTVALSIAVSPALQP